MKHDDLVRLLKGEQPEAGFFEPEGDEWGGLLDLVAIEDGRIIGYVQVLNRLDLDCFSESAFRLSQVFTEAWVFTTPELAAGVKKSAPLSFGVRILVSGGRVGIGRPATVSVGQTPSWLARLTPIERLRIAAEVGSTSTTQDVYRRGLAVLGEDGLRRRIVREFGTRCASPPPPLGEIDNVTILAAVRRRLSSEPVAPI